MFRDSSPFVRFRILKTICALLLKKGEAVSHRSIPARTGTHTALSVLRWSRRNPSVLGLPHSTSVALAFRLVRSAVAPLRGYAPAPLTRVRRLLRLRAPPSFGWRIPKCPLRAAARRLPLHLRGSLHGSSSPSSDTPTCSKYEKKGGVSASLRGCQMSDSQSVRHGLKRGRIQRSSRLRHRQVEEPDAHRVAVLSLDNGATAPSTRDFGRSRVSLGNSP